MSDLSFYAALSEQSGGGTTDYNGLSNRPVINISGEGIVINSLSTGVYNISGTWKMTEDDTTHLTQNDDLFYVLNDGETTKLTWISAGQIKTYSVPDDGSASDITEEGIATADEVVRQMVGNF